MPTTRKNNKTRTNTRTSAKKNTARKTTASKKTKTTWNFGTTFKSAVKRGTPATTAVWNISRKTGKSESFIWNWLFKNGYVNRKSVNGSHIFWPNFEFTATATTKNFKGFSFQQFVNWAIASGYCTASQVNNLKSQKEFFNFFGPFLAQQFGWNVNSGWTATKVKNFGNGNSTTSRTKTSKKKSTGTKSKKRTTTSKSKKRTTAKTTGRKTTGSRNYTFPTTGTARGTRTYRKAA